MRRVRLWSARWTPGCVDLSLENTKFILFFNAFQWIAGWRLWSNQACPLDAGLDAHWTPGCIDFSLKDQWFSLCSMFFNGLHVGAGSREWAGGNISLRNLL